MPITIDQLAPMSLSLNGDGAVEAARERWFVHGTNDENQVKDLVLAAAPGSYSGLLRMGVEVQTTDSLYWEADVVYGLNTDDDPEFAFEIGTQSQHITHAIDQTAYNPTGLTAPDVGKAIGVTADSIDGVDILVPTGSFSFNAKLTDAQCTLAYQDSLFQLTGRVNATAWKGKAAGEVLFLGSTGSKRGRAKWDVHWRFAYSKNVTNVTIAGVPNVSKKGWEYLWTINGDKVDNTAKALTKQVRGLYVAQTYPAGDFSVLGLGS